MLSYNIHDGAQEGIIHGYKNGILRTEDYSNIAQCDTLEDMKLHLAGTDFGNFLQNEATLSSKGITERALDRLVNEFMELRSGADEPLATFLDFITYEYMIANVLKLISGAKAGRETLDLLYKCHPLGLFEGIGALTAASSADDMYEIVLIDSPLGQFFQRTEKKDFDEFSMEYIRSNLHKNYLEHFYDFCRDLGGETWTVMSEILDFEADRFVLTLTRNTYGVKELQKEDRKKLFPAFGKLADIHDDLAACDDDDSLREKLRNFSEYLDMLDSGSEESGLSNLENRFMVKAAQLHKDSLARQFHFGIFYSWVKLRELEVNNLMWIAECIVQSMKHRITEYVPIY
jgi:V-type H+-transporting ATPase subunit d